MIEYFVLGCSHSILSLYAENVYAEDFPARITVVLNAPIKDEHIPYSIDGLDIRKVMAEHVPDTVFERVIVGVDRPSTKHKIFDFFAKHHGVLREQYTNLVHPSVVLAHTVEMNKGIYMGPGVIVAPYAKIGHSVTINRGVTIGHHTVIGDFVTIAPGVNIAGHCRISDGVTIGVGANIIDGIQIGMGTTIGSGALVTKPIKPSVVAYGVPAKVIRGAL